MKDWNGIIDRTYVAPEKAKHIIRIKMPVAELPLYSDEVPGYAKYMSGGKDVVHVYYQFARSLNHVAGPQEVRAHRRDMKKIAKRFFGPDGLGCKAFNKHTKAHKAGKCDCQH